MKLLKFVALYFRPPGVFEYPNFAKGTIALMDAVVQATQNGATTIIGKGSQCLSVYIITI
jgi:phosphoglycerate kinase